MQSELQVIFCLKYTCTQKVQLLISHFLVRNDITKTKNIKQQIHYQLKVKHISQGKNTKKFLSIIQLMLHRSGLKTTMLMLRQSPALNHPEYVAGLVNRCKLRTPLRNLKELEQCRAKKKYVQLCKAHTDRSTQTHRLQLLPEVPQLNTDLRGRSIFWCVIFILEVNESVFILTVDHCQKA